MIQNIMLNMFTVPGVLKHADIAFYPYLPLYKRQYIIKLEMGILNKIFWDIIILIAIE